MWFVFSLVDVRSTPTNVMDHFHRLVDCRKSAEPIWSVETRMAADGRAVFKEFGIVKSLESDKVKEVAERMICRREEVGDDYARTNKWEKTQITNKAEQQSRETSSSRLRLCFEAFLRDESSKIVKVCEPALSEEILDLNNVSSGEFSVQKMSLCSDYVEGGAEVMIFTNKVNYSRSSFFAEFFQLRDPESGDSTKVWERRVAIPESGLHTVGQHLGGLSFNVPMYDRSTRDTPELLDSEVTCYFQLVKATKNNTVQARTDRLLFTYKSRRISGGAKRKLPEETVQKIFNHPKFSKVDNFPDLNPTPIIEFSNLQTQAVTPLMTIVEEASQLPTVLVSQYMSPQYYGSSPQRQSPRSRSRSPVPQPSQEMPYLPDLMNDLEDLLGTNTTSYTNNMTSYYGNLDNIVTDGPKRDKKQNSKDTFKKEVKKEVDMLDKMSKLNI